MKRYIGKHHQHFISTVFLILTCMLKDSCVVRGGYHEKQLISHLLRHYNYLERPVVNETDALLLTFGITLQQIIDVKWNDYNLAWNKSEYGGVDSIRIHPKKLWVPDLLMYNSADERFDGSYQTNVVVSSDGNLLYVPPGIFKSTCKIDITWFPFDDQKCKLKFGSWTYDGWKLDLALKDPEKGGDITTFITNGEWKLVAVPGERHERYYDCCEEPYVDITFTIHIRRRTLYYFFNLIVPCVLISSMALLGFTLPPDSGEKLTLGVTILLSLTVFHNIVTETLPQVSDALPLLGTYFNCIMMMVASSVVLTVVVLNYHHRTAQTHDMPTWVYLVFLRWLPWILRMDRPGKKLKRRGGTRTNDVDENDIRQNSSKSLLANILDIDHHHLLHRDFKNDSRMNLNYNCGSSNFPHVNERNGGGLMKRESFTTTSGEDEDYSYACPSTREMHHHHQQPHQRYAASSQHPCKENFTKRKKKNIPAHSKTWQDHQHPCCPNNVEETSCHNENCNSSAASNLRFPVTHLSNNTQAHYIPPCQIDRPKSATSLRGLDTATTPYHNKSDGCRMNHVWYHQHQPTCVHTRRELENKPFHRSFSRQRDENCAIQFESNDNLMKDNNSSIVFDDNEDLMKGHECSTASKSVVSNLHLIYEELKFLTKTLREKEEVEEVEGDWKFAAMVIDRFCLITFTMFTIITTFVVLISAPHIIVE